jgi:hypothetical protein
VPVNDMKKVARFIVRLVLFVLAMVVAAPGILIFVEGPTLLPNFLGLAYVVAIVLIYKSSDEDEWPKKIAEIYRIAFREFFPDL